MSGTATLLARPKNFEGLPKTIQTLTIVNSGDSIENTTLVVTTP